MILCPRRHDRCGPIVCVSHSERQNTVRQMLFHKQGKQKWEETISPLLPRLNLSLITFSQLSSLLSRPQKYFSHFRTGGMTKNLCRRNSWPVHLFSYSPSKLIFKTHLPETQETTMTFTSNFCRCENYDEGLKLDSYFYLHKEFWHGRMMRFFCLFHEL